MKSYQLRSNEINRSSIFHEEKILCLRGSVSYNARIVVTKNVFSCGFTNTNIPEKRFRVCLNESEINDLLKT